MEDQASPPAPSPEPEVYGGTDLSVESLPRDALINLIKQQSAHIDRLAQDLVGAIELLTQLCTKYEIELTIAPRK